MKQTDNSHYREKRQIREEAANKHNGEASVLDCFAGEGRMWRGIKVGRLVQIEKEKGKNSKSITGDCTKILKTIDLNRFNIVDLDAYGVPFEQLDILFERKYKGSVIVTAISNTMGKLPFRLLNKIGFTKEMYNLSPISCSLIGMEALFSYLANNGVKELYGFFIESERKYYFSFEM